MWAELSHEIGPQRGSQKAHPFDDRLIAVEDADIGAGAQLFEFRQGARNAAPVELVVSGNLKNRLGEAQCPRSRGLGATDISCQDDQIGIRIGKL